MAYEEDPWNVFRSHKRASQEEPSLSSWIVTSTQFLKLLLFVSGSIFLSLGVVFSKTAVLLLATNLGESSLRDSFQQACVLNSAIDEKTRAAAFIALALVQCLPDICSLAQSLLRIKRGEKAGEIHSQVLILEILRTIGLAILFFQVMPHLDIQRGLYLLFCLPIVAVVQRFLAAMANASRNASSFSSRIIRMFLTFPHFLGMLLVLSSAYLWSIMDVPFHANIALPTGLLLSSIGFWESWVHAHHEKTAFHSLFEIKYGLNKLNPSTRIYQCLARIIIIIVMVIISASNVKAGAFWTVVSSYSFSSPHTRLLIFSIALVLLHGALRGCARFLAALNMRLLLILHPTTMAPLILAGLLRYVCGNNSCGFAKIFRSFGLTWRCDVWGDSAQPFQDWILFYIWIIVGSYRAFRYVLQEEYDKTDEVIDALSPSTVGYCVEHSLVVFQHAVSKKVRIVEMDDDDSASGDEQIVRNDDVDGAMTVYICATMWHETTTEMTQMMKSILKLDEEQMRRKNNKKPGQLQFQLEGHIFFDDAWTTNAYGDKVPNEYFEMFFNTLNELTGEKLDEHGRLASRVLVSTPYGGRVVVKLPAGTLLFVHLKDKAEIRHKKRWSQVMYMYYLLGHRIMDSPLSLEDRQQMAEKTFILAIDGDSKFEPEAVVRLLSLMQQKNDIGCACGRIHPIGSGVMVWYQKFEYAIAHWFQKAAEHVFGCVLCAPGCFSLFRASALMDDNIMYTKTAMEPRHFVQYDQGEDRWLSTLMLKQGYRIEYAAASDAETYAPEGFEEFFNQRRRWTPSSIANTVDLLMDYKRAAENNASISYAYIAYQFIVIAFSMLGPAIIFSMVVYAQVAAFGVDSSKMFLYNGIPIATFIFLCFTTESNVQLWFAKIMSIIYAFVMLAVLVATTSQIVLETVVSPTSMFIVTMVAIFFGAACLHPCEFSNIIYGTVFFLMIPSTYVFLTLYSLINLNVINWGTREAVAKATGQVNKPRGLQKWLKQGLEAIGRCLPRRCGGRDPEMDEIKKRMEELEIQLVDRQQSDNDTKAGQPKSQEPETSEEVVIRIEEDEKREPKSWMDYDYLQVCERGRLKVAEHEFWTQLIEKYLKPVKSTPEEQRAVASGLASLRNQIAFALLLLNALLALAIYLIQKHKNVLSIRWTPYEGFKWTKMNEEKGQYEETDDPLKIDPLGMLIIAFLMGILIVQTIGMFIHRLNTLVGAFQEVDQLHELLSSQTKKHSDDERVLSAARLMLDVNREGGGGHAADGYTRHGAEEGGDEHVLFKLQRARLAAKLKQSGMS